jgi:hypothetical protein
MNLPPPQPLAFNKISNTHAGVNLVMRKFSLTFQQVLKLPAHS